MTYTYSSLIAGAIKSFLEHREFELDRESTSGGFHGTAFGVRLQMVDPSGQKYEILVNPLFDHEQAVAHEQS